MLQEIDHVRRRVAPTLDAKQKADLGQFMTPAAVARFMASLFTDRPRQACRLLDPGAGVGSLTAAFLDRWARAGFDFQRVEVTAYEIDDTLRSHLEETLGAYAVRLPVTADVRAEDFIVRGSEESRTGGEESRSGGGTFTHAIMNPPYKKIGTGSEHRLELSRVGIETVNLYSGFVALALRQMEPGGELVAILPRSFCNGPYYRPFRQYILSHAALRHMHLFDSRSKTFEDDAVLQENLIVVLERGGKQGDVTVSTSTDDRFDDYAELAHPFDRIVFPDDAEGFIHVPTTTERGVLEELSGVRFTLDEVGVKVSTGPVVDFRLREHLCERPERGCVPLLYPAHFAGDGLQWPVPNAKKPNAIRRNDATERWLYPAGFYTVVRRFSSKEERRRVVASVLDPSVFPDAEAVGIENHLNVFHHGKRGLPEELARGLAVFLNSTAVDEQFRRFSGHTQVNVTDLKQIRYPSREVLAALGRWERSQRSLSQELVDDQLHKLTL